MCAIRHWHSYAEIILIASARLTVFSCTVTRNCWKRSRNGAGHAFGSSAFDRMALLPTEATFGTQTDPLLAEEAPKASGVSRPFLLHASNKIEAIETERTRHITEDVQTDKDYTPHPDERQVALDVDRSFIIYPKGSESSDCSCLWAQPHTPVVEQHDQKAILQNELNELIVSLLRRHPSMHYFQVSEILLANSIHQTFLRDFMISSQFYSLLSQKK
jgi:hypothetical protein